MTAWQVVGAAGCAAVAVWLQAGPGDRRRAARILAARTGPGNGARVHPFLAWWRTVPARRRVAVTGVLSGAAVWLTTGGPVALPLAFAATVFVHRRRRAAAAAHEETARRGRTAEIAGALAAELRAGRDPSAALGSAVAGVPGAADDGLADVVAAARSGADVPAALESAGARPGGSGLRRIAACWRVAVGPGGPAAPALDRVAAGLRAEDRARAGIEAELAGVRATARMLAGLPVLGVVLGSGLGADPVGVLFRTPYGVACLLAGTALLAGGLVWTDRMARTALTGGSVA